MKYLRKQFTYSARASLPKIAFKKISNFRPSVGTQIATLPPQANGQTFIKYIIIILELRRESGAILKFVTIDTINGCFTRKFYTLLDVVRDGRTSQLLILKVKTSSL